MSYKCVSGSSVDFFTFVSQRQSDTFAGYYIWPETAGHAIRQLLRSLWCRINIISQGHKSMVTVCVCVFVCVEDSNGVFETLRADRNGFLVNRFNCFTRCYEIAVQVQLRFLY